MDNATFWHKQTQGKPLFPDLLWSRPEHRGSAGKLLIIGGNAFGFAAPAEAYAEAMKAGIGAARVLLPDKLKSTVGRVLEAGDYALSTPSGSFSQKALGEFLSQASWADAVLVAGDVGRNSETAVLLEKFAGNYTGLLAVTKDAADYFVPAPQAILQRTGTVLILSFAQLQKMGTKAKFSRVFTFDMGAAKLAEALHEFTSLYPVHIVTKHLGVIFAASGGQVSSTDTGDDQDLWRVRASAHAAVWWLQNPSRPFQALASAAYELLA